MPPYRLKLEEEIQQRNFKSPQQRLAVNIFYTAGWLNAHYSKFFKSTDLTTQQFNVLRILRGQHPRPCSLKLIKERMLDRMSDASRIVDKLVSKKFVERTECPSDRRSINLVISEKGLKMLEKLDCIDEEIKLILKKLNSREVNQLNVLLDKLRG